MIADVKGSADRSYSLRERLTLSFVGFVNLALCIAAGTRVWRRRAHHVRPPLQAGLSHWNGAFLNMRLFQRLKSLFCWSKV